MPVAGGPAAGPDWGSGGGRWTWEVRARLVGGRNVGARERRGRETARGRKEAGGWGWEGQEDAAGEASAVGRSWVRGGLEVPVVPVECQP